MDKNSNFLDEIARAAERESGDANKAWQLLAIGVDAADVPVWVKDYVKRSAAVIADYDTETGDQARLAHMLGFYKEKETPRPSGYDYDGIFEWFVERMTEQAEMGIGLNISRTAREYVEEVLKMNGNPDAVRKAYEKARARFNAQLKQDIELQQVLEEYKK